MRLHAPAQARGPGGSARRVGGRACPASTRARVPTGELRMIRTASGCPASSRTGPRRIAASNCRVPRNAHPTGQPDRGPARRASAARRVRSRLCATHAPPTRRGRVQQLRPPPGPDDVRAPAGLSDPRAAATCRMVAHRPRPAVPAHGAPRRPCRMAALEAAAAALLLPAAQQQHDTALRAIAALEAAPAATLGRARTSIDLQPRR